MPVVVVPIIDPEGVEGVTIGGATVPERMGMMFLLEGHQLEVRLDLVAEDGTYAVDELHARRLPGSPPLNISRLRDDLPLEELVDIAMATISNSIAEKLGQPAQDWNALTPPKRTSRNWVVTDEHLKEVAEVYRSAPSAPTEAVAKRFPPVSHRQASRWVAKARERGFLPPTTKGKGAV